MVQPYVFMTDSDSDLPFSIADERNIPEANRSEVVLDKQKKLYLKPSVKIMELKQKTNLLQASLPETIDVIIGG